MNCVYLITYSGDVHPPYYIGSTSIQNIKMGYLGSTSSKKYKDIVLNEQSHNRNLYTITIIQTTNTRKEALEIENKIQREFLVAKSTLFWNMSYASVNGFFGNGAVGAATSMYGRKHSKKTINQMKNHIVVRDKNNNIFRTRTDDPLYLSGELIPHRRGKKLNLSEDAIKKRTHKGSSNPSAKKFVLYDTRDNIIFESFGNLKEKCEEIGMNYSSAQGSFMNDRKMYTRYKSHKHKGWYVVEIPVYK